MHFPVSFLYLINVWVAQPLAMAIQIHMFEKFIRCDDVDYLYKLFIKVVLKSYGKKFSV